MGNKLILGQTFVLFNKPGYCPKHTLSWIHYFRLVKFLDVSPTVKKKVAGVSIRLYNMLNRFNSC